MRRCACAQNEFRKRGFYGVGTTASCSFVRAICWAPSRKRTLRAYTQHTHTTHVFASSVPLCQTSCFILIHSHWLCSASITARGWRLVCPSFGLFLPVFMGFLSGVFFLFRCYSCYLIATPLEEVIFFWSTGKYWSENSDVYLFKIIVHVKRCADGNRMNLRPFIYSPLRTQNVLMKSARYYSCRDINASRNYQTQTTSRCAANWNSIEVKHTLLSEEVCLKANLEVSVNLIKSCSARIQHFTIAALQINY